MSVTAYPTLRLKLTMPQALKLQFLPAVPGFNASTAAALIANKVDRAGDTMTGFLTLSANPTAALHAATKQYVDAGGGGSGGPFLPVTNPNALGALTVSTVGGNVATLQGSAAAAQSVTLTASGADAAVNIHIQPKGSAGVLLYSNGSLQALVSGPASTARYLVFSGSAAGNPAIAAGGGGNVTIADVVLTGNPTAPTPAAGDNDTSVATTAFVRAAARELLTATRNYFVNASTGSDSNNGLAAVSSGGNAPFLTIQKAIDVAATLDTAQGFAININVADGTYTGGMILKTIAGAGGCAITGNVATPTNCIVSVTGGFPVIGNGVRGQYTVQGFHLKALTAGFSCVLALKSTLLSIQNIRFEGETHIKGTFGAQIFHNATGVASSTAGNFNIHIYADTQALVQEAGHTGAQSLLITGSPTIAQAWAFVLQGATVISNGNTYSGAVTSGIRYSVASVSYLFTGTSASATYFPGTVNGSSATGGVYD